MSRVAYIAPPSVPGAKGDKGDTGAPGEVTAASLAAQLAALAAVYATKVSLAVNPKDAAYGALGNDAHDDTAAVQAAITAAAAGSGWCYIPAGIYRITDALIIPSNVVLFGLGAPSVLKSVSLVDGGAGHSHRQLEASNASGFRVQDLTLDASLMTVFTAGMRSILLVDCNDYRIERCIFRTPGAATASINCYDFRIVSNDVDIVSADGIAKHDGIIDQWGGSHDFTVYDNTVDGHGIGQYAVLVTGQTTAGTPAACYDFTIHGNRLTNLLSVGVWVNGRDGVNHDFLIHDNQITNVTTYFGIAVSDSREFSINDNGVTSTGANSIRVYSETGAAGTTGGRSGVVANNVCASANVTAFPAGPDGSAISVTDNSDSVGVYDNRVKGSGHVYAVYFAATTTNSDHSGRLYDTGTAPAGLLVFNNPNGGTYTPALTGVANVAASTPRAARWSRKDDVITVTGRVEVTPTAAGSTATQLGMALPVPSGFTDVNVDASGQANSSFGVLAAINADVVNDRVQLQFAATNTSSNVLYYSYSYAVKP